MSHLRSILRNDWVAAAGLLLIFLATNGYTYGWDDQHLEIPHLKSLINPALYPGDYYVDALRHNFTSYLYPILAKVISTDQIPTTYFTLFLISRTLLFFFAFKLWRQITGEWSAAWACSLASIAFLRTSDFLYRTFSHQEFALVFAFAGLYLWYQNKYYWAALMWGIGSNFHALYNLFPMTYLALECLLRLNKEWFKRLVVSGSIYLACATPFIVWTSSTMLSASQGGSPEASKWIPLFLLACPQNFPYGDIPWEQVRQSLAIALLKLAPYWHLAILFGVLAFHFPEGRKDKRLKAMAIMTLITFIIAFIFTYVYPSKLVINLNLYRNTQFLGYFLYGYTIWLMLKISQSHVGLVAWLTLMGTTLQYLSEPYKIIGAWVIFCALAIPKALSKERALQRNGLLLLILLGMLLGLGAALKITQAAPLPLKAFDKLFWTAGIGGGILICSGLIRKSPWSRIISSQQIWIPILIFVIWFSHFHYHHWQSVKNGKGFWGLQNDWVDMQQFVQKNTPLSAQLLVPNDMEMGGFRIHSERKILVDYRDCGVVGFNYPAAEEWFKRMKAVWGFKVLVDPQYSLESALFKAVEQYKVNYIVFMKYYAPPQSLAGLTKIYENGHFCLFKVEQNPIF